MDSDHLFWRRELRTLRRHSGTLKRGGHAKYLPYAFTEQGVAMLSSVLCFGIYLVIGICDLEF